MVQVDSKALMRTTGVQMPPMVYVDIHQEENTSREVNQRPDGDRKAQRETVYRKIEASPLGHSLCSPKQLQQDKIELNDIHLEEGR